MSDLQESNDKLADLIDEMKRRWQLSREQLQLAEKCIEEIRAELAKVAPRSVTFRRIRDALNRYDEAK